jgi:arylsulfatase A-like enzyme
VRAILRQALWFGLGAGLLEAAVLTAHHRLIHGFIYLSPHLVWMAPVANIAWFGIPALLLLLLSRWWPRLRAPGVTIAVFSFLAALSMLLIPSQLHRVAALVLALGIGIQAGRMLAKRSEGFNGLVRRTLPIMAALVLLLAVGTIGWGIYRERRDAKRLGAARAGAPNIVLIVLDTVRRASLSMYGYQRPTSPAMERWAARGVRFEHAFATASWTLPSHAGMFTGRLPHEMSAGWLRPLDGTWPTLAETLRDQGYLTAGFVANILYCNRSFGLGRGFVHYEDYRIAPGEFLVNASIGRALSESHLVRQLVGYHDIISRKSGESISRAFLEWEARQGDRPWFAFLNYFDAHQPFFPPEPDRFGPTRDRALALLELRPHMGKIEDAEHRLTPGQVEAERNAYDAALAYLDSQVDLVLRELEQRGKLKNTIVIVTSDHGEQFMEHGLFDHGNSLYRFAIEVPLFLLGPGVPQGSVSDPVSLRDLPATVMDLAGRQSRFPGRSLRAAWSGTADITIPVISETSGPSPRRWFKSIVASNRHAVWSADSTELYDFTADPAEIRTLSGERTGAEELDSLARTFQRETGQPPRP